jgi:tyrosyl-tRNA synthetase
MASIKIDEQSVDRLLAKGVTEIIDRGALRKELLSGKQLRVKLGIDPTAPDLHLGHTVVLRKLKDFQKLGHQAILVIGDFTASIGDPTGKNATRPPLSEKEIKQNMKTFVKQAGKVLDMSKVKVVYNSSWLKKLRADEMIKLVSQLSAQNMLEREDFKKRLRDHESLRLHELLYPVMQAYDSVVIDADVEIGGNDQLFNVLVGRELMGKLGRKPQNILTVTLLEGTDGKQKMSKSTGNYIGVLDAPNDMFGKVMAISDELVPKYFQLCTDISDDELVALPKNPRELKLRLAVEITTLYHGAKSAEAAKQNFIEVFSNKGVPKDIPTVTIASHGITLVELLIEADLVTSKSEARRLIEQGGVKINEIKKINPTETIAVEDGMIVQVGPRRFVRIARR